MSSPVLSVASRLVQEELVSLFFYPVWWYSKGFQGVLRWIHEGLRYRWRRYALTLWIRHIMTPMYGEYSFLGRAVSLFMRIVVIIGRSIAWLLEALVYLLLIFLWLAWPLAAVFGLLYTVLIRGVLRLA